MADGMLCDESLLKKAGFAVTGVMRIEKPRPRRFRLNFYLPKLNREKVDLDRQRILEELKEVYDSKDNRDNIY